MIHFFRIVILAISVFSLSYQSFAGIWEDDFSKKDNKNWEVVNIAAWQLDLEKNGAKWEIKNGEVYGSMHEHFKKSMFLTGELTWHNYTTSCHAKFVGDEDKTAMMGLILHARAVENKRYMFLLNYFDQKAIIVATAGPLKQGGEPFKGWSQKMIEFKIIFDTWYLLSASVVTDDQLQFKIRNLDDPTNIGEFKLKVLEPVEDGGLTGLLVENADAVFDNIKIEGKNIPNSGTFDIEPRSKLTTIWGRLKAN